MPSPKAILHCSVPAYSRKSTKEIRLCAEAMRLEDLPYNTR